MISIEDGKKHTKYDQFRNMWISLLMPPFPYFHILDHNSLLNMEIHHWLAALMLPYSFVELYGTALKLLCPQAKIWPVSLSEVPLERQRLLDQN